MTVAQTLERIHETADERNAEVIGEAFRRASIRCEHCNYPQNAGRFSGLLHDYTRARIDLHHAWRRYHRQIEEDPESQHACYWRMGKFDYARDHRNSLHRRLVLLRSELADIWPCDECIKAFNPTGKMKDIYPPRNAPKGKGFVEE